MVPKLLVRGFKPTSLSLQVKILLFLVPLTSLVILFR
jgi:hypothetical protein